MIGIVAIIFTFAGQNVRENLAKVVMASYPTTTYNGATFGISSLPMPSRVVTATETTGTARFMTTLVSPYENSTLNFEEAILGWSRVDPGHPERLNRYFPFSWPYHPQGCCDAIRCRVTSENKTADPDGTAVGGINPCTVNTTSDSVTYWPSSPFAMYDVDFGPLNYSRFLDDTDAYSGVNPPKELGRMIQVLEQPTPRELRVPDGGFERADNEQPILQVGFVPFIQSEVRYIWRQVPYPSAVPWTTIENSYLTVNQYAFDGDELSGWPSGTLLFRKVVDPDLWYYGPGGNKYVDMVYCFDYVYGGWNYAFVPTPLGYRYVQIQKKVTKQPAYASSDFRELFNPAAG